MQQVFSGLNAPEAHMISHLLGAGGIKTTVNGEQLVGARGDLPVHDMCSVWVVDDDDALRARALIAEWEKQNPPQPKTDKSASGKSGANVGLGSIIGFLLGAALMYSFFYSPITQEGADYNWDGKQDVTYFYQNGLVYETWSDLDFKGRIDRKDFYDQRGIINKTSLDTDLDGTMETTIDYQYGNAYKEARDYNGDGKPELVLNYSTTGALSSVQFFYPGGGKLVKTVEYKNGMAAKAQYDSDKDGVLDTEYTYDDFEEIKTKTPINQN